MEQLGTASATFNILCDVWLGSFLAVASYTDARSRRISNKLVLVGMLSGLALNTFLSDGSRLFGSMLGGVGLLGAIGGLAVGLCLLLPLYMLRAMGAGDVKLMAMVGAFLGPSAVFGAVLMTFLAGGIFALGVALWKGVLRNTLANVRSLMLNSVVKAMSGRGAQLEASGTVSGNLPYAFAITAGTTAQIFLAYSGHAIFT